MSDSSENLESTEVLLERLRSGDSDALNLLLRRHRDWIRRVVDIRLDQRLRPRIDPSDVVQDIQLEVSQRIEDYLVRNPMPFRLWLRQTASDKLVDLHRKHIDAEMRSVKKEIMLPQDSSLMLFQHLLGEHHPPDQRLLEEELLDRVHRAVNNLSEMDREILVLRFFEGLENEEVTQILQLKPATACKRYGRALRRLTEILSTQEQGE